MVGQPQGLLRRDDRRHGNGGKGAHPQAKGALQPQHGPQVGEHVLGLCQAVAGQDGIAAELVPVAAKLVERGFEAAKPGGLLRRDG